MEKLTATLPGSLQVGKDGISPVVQVSDIAGGHCITITDVNGTISFAVPDGKDGKSAYDYAIEAGYTGDSNTFANALVEALNGDGIVRSINGVAADENGNVDVVLPHFDLIAMGLPAVPFDNTAAVCECDTTAINEAAKNGPISVLVDTERETYEVIMTSISDDNVTQLTGTLCIVAADGAKPYAASIVIFEASLAAYITPMPVNAVKTVNGTAPDENGNVQVKTGDSDMTITFDENLNCSHSFPDIAEALKSGRIVKYIRFFDDTSERVTGGFVTHEFLGNDVYELRAGDLCINSEMSAWYDTNYSEANDDLYFGHEKHRRRIAALETNMGDISTALDHIIALQEELIGS